MMFISEGSIERAAEYVGDMDAEDFDLLLEVFENRHPLVMAFLLSEGFDLLTRSEKDLMFYMILVMREAIESESGNPPPKLDEETLGKKEEANWELVAPIQSKIFRERVDVFFKNYPQEDLLAFVEDLLSDDEEEVVTKGGREYIFIAMKSIIDAWAGHSIPKPG